MAYQLINADNITVITDTDNDLRVKVTEQKTAGALSGSPYCIGTLYRIKGGFIPEKIFFFQAMTPVNVETLKKAMDFFFGTLLETELYVKEVPRDSLLFGQEALRLYGEIKEEIHDGTIGTVCPGRSE